MGVGPQQAAFGYFWDSQRAGKLYDAIVFENDAVARAEDMDRVPWFATAFRANGVLLGVGAEATSYLSLLHGTAVFLVGRPLAEAPNQTFEGNVLYPAAVVGGTLAARMVLQEYLGRRAAEQDERSLSLEDWAQPSR